MGAVVTLIHGSSGMRFFTLTGPCASQPPRSPWSSARCWGVGSVALCCAAAQPCSDMLRWISVTAAATLMLATGTTIRKSLLVPFFALQAPFGAIVWIRDEYGRWIASLGLLVRLLYFIPGELELPLSTMLLVMAAPYQFTNWRGSQGGTILSAAIAAYLAFQHFTGVGGLKRAFGRESVIATFCVTCMTVITLMLVL